MVGGKGAALDQLIGFGFPVPPSAAVTTEAYRCFARAPEIAALLADLDGRPIPTGEELEATRREVDDCFLSAPMPAEVWEAVVSALDGERGPWAVRSSATAEDLGGASFAGQYSSFLDVTEAGLERALRLVWASLWYPAPRAYRRFRAIDERDLSMAVVVMHMLRPSHAGVLFTTDPLGRPDDVRVEVVAGLGEQLVSGEATPDIVLVPRGTPTVGPADLPFVSELVAMGLRAEASMGVPQDIEWAVEDGRLHLVQARPITTALDEGPQGDGFDTVASDGVTFTTAGIAEMLPGHLGPRLWTLNQPLIEDGFRGLFGQLGADDPALADPDDALVDRIRGRAVLDLDLMKRAAGSIPGGSAEELEHQYFGDMTSARVSTPTRSSPLATMRQGTRTLKARTAAALESEITIQVVDAVLAAEPDVREATDTSLLSLRARTLHFAARAMAAEIAVAAMATASYRSVEAFLARHLKGTDATSAAQAMTSGSPGGRGGVLGADLAALAERADDTAVRRALDEPDWSRAVSQLESSVGGRSFLAAFRGCLDRSASMSVFGGPTWRDAPELAWLTMVSNRDDTEVTERRRVDARRAVERQLSADPAWRQHRALHLHVVDVRRHFLRREAAEATAFLDRRERTKAAVLRLGGLVRRIDEEIARRVVATGRLEDVEDIEFVATSELAPLVQGEGPSPQTLAHRRRVGVEASSAGPLPRAFTGIPEPVSHVEVAGDRLQGWAASPGRYEGPARLVTRPSESGLRRGDVLVAGNTDASWAPLFLLAGAIVVEEGGPLSHAAIVARELGVPAVVNVPGIVDRLERETDDLAIVVDGSSGELVLHPSAVSGSGEPDLEGVVPTRPTPQITDAGGGGGVHVFVTGLIGAGAAMSALFALTEAIGSKRAERRFDRRAKPVATNLSTAIVDGFEAAARHPSGLRPQRHHVWAAAGMALLAAFLLLESAEAYFESSPGGSTTLFWALMTLTGMQIGALAVLAAVAASRWPEVPAEVRRYWSAPDQRLLPRRRIDRLALRAAAFFLGLFVVLTIVNLWLPGLLTDMDKRLYDAMDASPATERIGPEWLGWFGRPRLVIPLAILIGLASVRCRILAMLFPASVVVAGLVNVGMWVLVAKQRPLVGIHAGRLDSFPGGHAVTVTLLAGVLPLAVHAITSRRWAAQITRVVVTVAAAVLLVDQVRQGGHWPTDQAAGAVLGLAGVLAIHAAVASPPLHDQCRECPWKQRTSVEEPT